MGKGKKLVLQITIVSALLALGLALASAIILQSIWMIVIVLGAIVFSIFSYVKLRHKRKQKYPLVPPEGKADIYLPRTDIPRPIHKDFRELREKKRKFDKLKKLIRKGKRK